MDNQKILRSGREEDIEEYFQKNSFWKNVLLPIGAGAIVALLVMLFPILAALSDPASDIVGLIKTLLVMYLATIYILSPLLMMISYDGKREQKYFFADFPNVNGWQNLGKVLWFSPFFPVMIVSTRAMKRKARSEAEWERKDRERYAEFSVPAEAEKVASEETEENLLQYCFESWTLYTTKRRRENWLPEADALRAEIREYERKIAEAKIMLANKERFLEKYPEGAEPDPVEREQLVQVYEKLKAIPEVRKFRARRENGELSVYVLVDIQHTSSDQKTYHLGLYGLSFERGEYSCCCISSGLTSAGHMHFSRFDTEEWNQDVTQIAPVHIHQGDLDNTVHGFVHNVRQHKIAGIPEKDLHYYFREV